MKRHGIKPKPVENRSHVAGVGVAYVSPFGVTDSKNIRMIFIYIIYRHFEFLYSLITSRFVKSAIGFIASSIFMRLVDNPFIKFKYWKFVFQKMFWNFFYIWIQPNTKKRIYFFSSCVVFVDNHIIFNVINFRRPSNLIICLILTFSVLLNIFYRGLALY